MTDVSSRPPVPSNAPQDALKLRLLGDMHLEFGGRDVPLSAPKLRALIAYLHLAGPQTRDDLAELFWPGKTNQHIRQALYTLRALPGASEWLHESKDKVVTVTAVSDVQHARAHLQAGRIEEALNLLGNGEPLLAHPTGDYPPDFSEWLEEQRQTLTGTHIQALLGQARTLEAQQPDQARTLLRRATRIEPLNEEPYRALMRLEHRAGQTTEALQVFETLRQALQDEFKDSPQPPTPEDETLELLREIEAQDATGQASQRAQLLTPADLQDLEPLYGRETELLELQERLRSQPRTLLQGLGGMGKTRLAQEIVRTTLQDGQKALWLELGTEPIQTILPALLEPLNLRQPDPPAIQDALNKANIHLIVLDNAQSSYALATLLRTLPDTTPTLITSRQRLPRLPRLTLRRLERHASLNLMGHHLGQEKPTNPAPDPFTLDALSAILGDHPYALRLVALTLKGGQRSAQNLLKALTDARRTPGEYGLLRPLLQHSLQLLDPQSYEAYLGMGRLYAPHTTPELLALTLRRPTDDTERALYTLTEHGLTTRDTQPGRETVTYRMHDLTWHDARTYHAQHPHAALHATRTFAASNTGNPELLSAELPNLIGAAQHALDEERPHDLIALMSGWLGQRYIAARGYPTGHLHLLQAAVTAAEQAQDWASAALLGGKLGDVQQALLGEDQAAIHSYLRGVQSAANAALASEQATMTAIAGFLQAKCQHPEATQTMQTALALAEGSGDLICHARVLEQQGIVAAALREDFVAARDSFDQARLLLIPLLSEEHPQHGPGEAAFGDVSANLGKAYICLGDYVKAKQHISDSLRVALASDHHLRTARAYTDLGETFHHLAEIDEARDAYQKAILLYRGIGAAPLEAMVQNMLNALPGRET